MTWKISGEKQVSVGSIYKFENCATLEYAVTGDYDFSNCIFTSFGFKFLKISSSSLPEIKFGCSEVTFEFYSFLSRIRSKLIEPIIPIDGIDTSIRLTFTNGFIKIYVNDVLLEESYDFNENDLTFFIHIKCDNFIISTTKGDNKGAFFPALIPHLWTSRPFMIYLRHFHLRGIHTNPECVYSERPLNPLPGLGGIYYFELIIKSHFCNSLNFAIGIVNFPHNSSDFIPGKSIGSFGLTLYDGIFRAPTFPDTKIPLTDLNLKDENTVGIGVNSLQQPFITINGKFVFLYPHNVSQFTSFYPVICTFTKSEEAILNLGQLPFMYSKISPPPGWSFYDPEPTLTQPFFDKPLVIPDFKEFKNGPPSESHLLHFYPFTLFYEDDNNNKFTDTFISKSNQSDFEVILLSPIDTKSDLSVTFLKDSTPPERIFHDETFRFKSPNKSEDFGNLSDLLSTLSYGSFCTLSALHNDSFFISILKFKESEFCYAKPFSGNEPSHPAFSVSGPLMFFINLGELPMVVDKEKIFEVDLESACQKSVSLHRNNKNNLTRHWRPTPNGTEEEEGIIENSGISSRLTENIENDLEEDNEETNTNERDDLTEITSSIEKNEEENNTEGDFFSQHINMIDVKIPHREGDEFGEELINGMKVKLSYDMIRLADFEPNSIIEARDRSLIACLKGDYNGIFMVSFPNSSIIYPLNIRGPLELMTTFRVLQSPSLKEKQTLIGETGPLFCTISIKPSLVPTNFGLTFIQGVIDNNTYVLRPLEDLFNNKNCRALKKKLSNIGVGFEYSKIGLYGKTPLLILKEDFFTSVWDGKYLEVMKDKPQGDYLIPKFLFFRPYFPVIEYYNISVRFAMGLQDSGKAYPLNWFGSIGHHFFNRSLTQMSFGSRGIERVPPLLYHFIQTLNDFISANPQKEEKDSDELYPDFIYHNAC